jgi:tRNA threonylcarbamoyladenosine modification (KEOPS) complex Cgi121 subunit
LRIEQVGVERKVDVVGIAEIHNSNHLKQSDLIHLAKSLSSDSLMVQLMNGLLIADETHLLSAAQNALNAKQGKYMHSRSLDVEIIVFASAQRQIGRALDALGIYDDIDEIAVVVVGTDPSSVEDCIRDLTDKIGIETIPPFVATSERLARIKDHYQISDKEIGAISESDKIDSQLAALSRCIVSRISLVAFDS